MPALLARMSITPKRSAAAWRASRIGVGIGLVERQRERGLGSRLRDELGRLVGMRARARGDDDVRPLFREANCDRAPDACPRARDERGPALDPAAHALSCASWVISPAPDPCDRTSMVCS